MKTQQAGGVTDPRYPSYYISLIHHTSYPPYPYFIIRLAASHLLWLMATQTQLCILPVETDCVASFINNNPRYWQIEHRHYVFTRPTTMLPLSPASPEVTSQCLSDSFQWYHAIYGLYRLGKYLHKMGSYQSRKGRDCVRYLYQKIHGGDGMDML